MRNAEAAILREEYATLIKIADGLLAAILTGAVCNCLTMARMAEEARSAARKIASAIEQMNRGVCRPLRVLAAPEAVRNMPVGPALFQTHPKIEKAPPRRFAGRGFTHSVLSFALSPPLFNCPRTSTSFGGSGNPKAVAFSSTLMASFAV